MTLCGNKKRNSDWSFTKIKKKKKDKIYRLSTNILKIKSLYFIFYIMFNVYFCQ